MKEERHIIKLINYYPLFYKNNNADLQNVFGKNMKSYYQHYIQFGRNEGRKAHN